MKKRLARLFDALAIARKRRNYREAVRIIKRIFKIKEEV